MAEETEETEEKDFYFHAVEIAVPAANGKEAYTKLCEALAAAGFDWTTDTFSTEDSEEEQPTSLLFPAHEEEEEEEAQS